LEWISNSPTVYTETIKHPLIVKNQKILIAKDHISKMTLKIITQTNRLLFFLKSKMTRISHRSINLTRFLTPIIHRAGMITSTLELRPMIKIVRRKMKATEDMVANKISLRMLPPY